MDGRNILVTGGAGFIGSALVRYLIRETEERVCVVDKLTYAGNLESLAEVSGSDGPTSATGRNWTGFSVNSARMR